MARRRRVLSETAAPAGVVTAGAALRAVECARRAASRGAIGRRPSVQAESAGCGAFVGTVRFTRVVTAAPWELLERLDAAALDATQVHNDLCAQFDERGPQPCSCGIPALLTDLADWLSAQAADAALSEARRAA